MYLHHGFIRYLLINIAYSRTISRPSVENRHFLPEQDEFIRNTVTHEEPVLVARLEPHDADASVKQSGMNFEYGEALGQIYGQEDSGLNISQQEIHLKPRRLFKFPIFRPKFPKIRPKFPKFRPKFPKFKAGHHGPRHKKIFSKERGRGLTNKFRSKKHTGNRNANIKSSNANLRPTKSMKESGGNGANIPGAGAGTGGSTRESSGGSLNNPQKVGDAGTSRDIANGVDNKIIGKSGKTSGHSKGSFAPNYSDKLEFGPENQRQHSGFIADSGTNTGNLVNELAYGVIGKFGGGGLNREPVTDDSPQDGSVVDQDNKVDDGRARNGRARNSNSRNGKVGNDNI